MLESDGFFVTIGREILVGVAGRRALTRWCAVVLLRV